MTSTPNPEQPQRYQPKEKHADLHQQHFDAAPAIGPGERQHTLDQCPVGHRRAWYETNRFQWWGEVPGAISNAAMQPSIYLWQIFYG
jgi:hypothetical protein